MRRFILSMVALAAMGVWQGCSFLETDPKILTDKSAYVTENDALAGLMGVYGILNNATTYGYNYSVMMSVDDLCYNNRQIKQANLFNYNYGPELSALNSVWQAFYSGIKNANGFLEAVGDNPDVLDPKGIMTAEARFLRAYYHFLLSQAWGDVPLRDSSVESPDNVQLEATSQEDVMLWCVREIESVLDALSNDKSLEPSRVTRATAWGILARIYLFLAGERMEGVDKIQMYSKAAHWAGEVINAGGRQLNPDYSKVFINMMTDKYDTIYHESMWEADFVGDRSSEGWTNGRIGNVIGMGCLNNSDTKYSEWASNYCYGYYNGSSYLWDLYWTQDRTDEESSDSEEISDSRQAWNMAPYNYNGSGEKYRVGRDMTPYSGNGTNTFEDITACRGVRNASKWRREKIYEGERDGTVGSQTYTSMNFPILRYSDVLLMYAEAINEKASGNEAAAFEYVKMVRDRAGIATKDYSEYASQQAMRELIRNERGRELCFEALRKYDLIRWGIFVEQMKNHSLWVHDEKWGNTGSKACEALMQTSGFVSEKHVYQPIPTKELSVNKLLKQNVLWR